MLIEKSIQPNEVVSLKLSNGDEIIAKLVERTETTVTVSKPLLMILSADPQTGRPGVQMAPFFMLGADKDSKFPINKSHIMCMMLANAEAKAGYTQNTTGLAIPTAGAVTKLAQQ